MPLCTDPAVVRERLNTDRAWCAYALGDLSPALAGRTEWHLGPDGAILLLYRAFETPVLFALGGPEAIAPLLPEIAAEPALYLSIRPDLRPLISAHYAVSHQAAMWRMTLAAAHFRPPAPGAARLGLEHMPQLSALYADGQATGEAPDFFDADMLAQGVFYGIWEGEALIAAAGTHLVVPEETVAAIGNVYTRRDRRGRGLAAQTTGAVAAALLAHKPPLNPIALNVNQANPAAVAVYERLGFRRYAPFYEGLARRRETA
jgi:GNAT superfamily N-acetyltransferase